MGGSIIKPIHKEDLTCPFHGDVDDTLRKIDQRVLIILLGVGVDMIARGYDFVLLHFFK